MLLLKALSDLCAGSEEVFRADCPIFLACPDPADRGIEGLSQEEVPSREERARVLRRAVIGGCWRNAGLSTPKEVDRFSCCGHASFAAALSSAISELESGVDSCFVGAVDSLVDEASLERFGWADRLKHEEKPTGLIPGEAAVLVELKRSGTGAAPRIAAVEIGPRPSDTRGEETLDGQGLAACVGRAATRGGAAVVPTALVVDLNGEVTRAREWGAAMIHLNANAPATQLHPPLLPALSLGDTGVASGAVGLAMASHLIERRALRCRDAIVVSSSMGDPHAAILIKSPEPAAR